MRPDRKSLLGLLLAASLLALGCGRSASPPQAGSPAEIDAPTVVLISIDTLRADRLGCYGRKGAETVTLDRIAAQGARFENASTTAPLTLPAHSSLLTGRTLPAHGVLNNGTFSLPTRVPTMAEAFTHAGYVTGAFVSSPVLARRYGLARGFERYDDQIAKSSGQQGIVVHYDERSSDETVTRALAFVENQGTKPILLWVHLWDPHAPYRPPEPFATKFASDRYQGEVAAADAAVGELLSGIEALGRGRRLVVAVVADHGEGLGDHGEPTHGLLLYRETTAIPFLISAPSLSIKPAVYQAPVSIADMAPTLLELMGVTGLDGADGRSLAGWIKGGAAPDRPGVFAESHLPQIEFGWSGLRAFVADDRTRTIEAPRPELYDEGADPGARQNLATSRAELLGKHLRELTSAVTVAQQAAPSGGDATLTSTQEQLERLQSLGYAASGRNSRSDRLVDPHGVDPKDRVSFVERFDRASARAREGALDEALAIYAELTKEDPRNPALWHNFGQSLIVAQQFDKALDAEQRATTLDPHFGLAWYRLGQLHDNAKRWEQAERCYRRAIAEEPENIDAHRALASLLVDRDRIHDAIAVLERAKDLDPGDAGLSKEIERLWSKARR